MENLKNNKKVISICLIIILVFIAIYFLVNIINDNKNKAFVEREEEISNYAANQYIPVYITLENMAEKYLNDFKNLVLTDANDAYEHLNSSYRNKKFGDINKFYDYINELDGSLFYSLKVEKYVIKTFDGCRFFDISASDGNRYIFKEKSIMNYEVYLDEYTVIVK